MSHFSRIVKKITPSVCISARGDVLLLRTLKDATDERGEKLSTNGRNSLNSSSLKTLISRQFRKFLNLDTPGPLWMATLRFRLGIFPDRGDGAYGMLDDFDEAAEGAISFGKRGIIPG